MPVTRRQEHICPGGSESAETLEALPGLLANVHDDAKQFGRKRAVLRWERAQVPQVRLVQNVRHPLRVKGVDGDSGMVEERREYLGLSLRIAPSEAEVIAQAVHVAG